MVLANPILILARTHFELCTAQPIVASADHKRSRMQTLSGDKVTRLAASAVSGEHVKEVPVFPLRPALAAEENAMRVIYRRCAGLDVHEKTVSACARILRGKELEIIEATFSTFTEDLEKLRDWLRRNRIRRVAMESTGVYWRPVWNILEPPPGKLDLRHACTEIIPRIQLSDQRSPYGNVPDVRNRGRVTRLSE